MRYFFPILRILAGIAVCIAVLMVSYTVKKRISPQQGVSVVEAGADVEDNEAVISSLIVEGESIERLAEL